MSQTTAPRINAVEGDDGLIAESFGPWDAGTGVAEGQIFVGRFVAAGTGGQQVKLPAAATDITGGAARGFAVKRQSRASKDDGLAPNFADKEALNYLRKGWVWTRAEDAVTKDAPVFVRHAVGNFGQVRSNADTANASQLPGAYFRSSAGAGELVLVELNLP